MSRRPSEEFLAALLITAVEHGGYGWFTVVEFHCPECDPKATYAFIDAPHSDLRRTRIDTQMMARGLAVIRRATGRLPDTPAAHDNQPVYHHADTGKRLYLSSGQRRHILTAARHDDAGQLDIVDALAVMEIALFGAVQFA